MSAQEILTAVLVFCFGTAIGSFLNVVIWRMPRGEQLSKGRSHCPHCSKELRAIDLIPVLSFVLQKGRCRYCSKRITARYPIIELATAGLFTIAYFLLIPVTGIDWLELFRIMFVIAVLTAVFVIDLEHYLILDKIILPATIIIFIIQIAIDGQVGSSLYWELIPQSLLGAVAGYVPFYLLWKISNGKWIGLGDAKLGLFLGVVFGFPEVWFCFLIAFFLGTLVAIPLLLSGKRSLGSKLPLGTFLAVAGILNLWFGDVLWTWYLSLIGFA